MRNHWPPSEAFEKEQLMPETILCAAIKVGELVLSVPRPGRHHTIINAFFTMYGHRLDEGYLPQGPSATATPWNARRPARFSEEQGFLTSKGRFVSRAEAWVIASEAGQIVQVCGGDGPSGITSESMW